ncbi:sulfatase-like hydrolase/transferase [Thalassoglobus sp. JC818]|uniref:sulfatase-like hydrolase/transferase n=1 Tax=Thalassoglobus sp. JC818 TaxID=3232136 RepID=UPI003459DE19
MRLFLLGLMITAFGNSNVIAAGERPNIVLILADDLGFETVGCYGGTSYATPNLDRLASGGIRFDRAYALPLCTNTRIQLMTGRLNLRNWKAFGILDPEATTIGHLLQRAGYKTCMAGKWQLTSYDPPDYPGAELRRNTGMLPKDAGFDEYSLWHVGHTEDKGSRYADPVIVQNGEELTGTSGKYGPDIWSDFIGEFIEQNQERPFFVYYSMALPHNPMVPTPDSPEWNDPEKRHVEETRLAKDMIEYTDKMVGKLVATLDALQLRDNTLVLFYSDNGTNVRVASRMGDRIVRGEKGKATELGIRVPAIANWPGTIQGGVVSKDLVDSVDLLPTLLDVAGAGELIPENVDGMSFANVLTQEESGSREWVYIHQDPRPGWDKDRFELIRVAIGERFKLYEDGRLIDLASDVFEENPLFVADDSPKEREARIALQKVLDSMRPYPIFDPSRVPRSDPSQVFERYQFQDQGGVIVVEAEMIPIQRDESWAMEIALPAATGIGYLRSLRSQSDSPESGVTKVSLNANIEGEWRAAVRVRSDHPESGHENSFWMKVADGPWMVGVLPKNVASGEWGWVDEFTVIDDPTERVDQWRFEELANEILIAPRSPNLKIDRLVFYQDDRKDLAKKLTLPVSDFHPWSSKYPAPGEEVGTTP